MKKFSNQKIQPLLFETYLALVKNSVGAKTFRNSYAKVGGKKKDILENGGLSCAFFVSSILMIFGLINEIHSTVGGTQRDLEKSGWKRSRKPKIGSVIVWEAVDPVRSPIIASVAQTLGGEVPLETLFLTGRTDLRLNPSGNAEHRATSNGVDFGRGEHKHIGFYVGGGKAISNHHKKGFPVVHHWTFGKKNGKEGRKVEAVYWDKKLD